MSSRWDPVQYARYEQERGRPFADLLARVAAERPALVVDLGCGHGPLTVGLAARWPGAHVVGVDSSPQMLARARELDRHGRVEWVEADVRQWDPRSLGASPDVIVTNATLQWVPRHVGLLPRWVGALAAGGWFALQVPANFDAPSHVLLRDTAAEHPRAVELTASLRGADSVGDAAAYADTLARLGCSVDAWETTYLHILDPEGRTANPVLEWTKATALRPVLDLLTDPAERQAFLDRYAAKLADAYPRRPYGTPLSFRRVFAVAQKEAPA